MEQLFKGPFRRTLREFTRELEIRNYSSMSILKYAGCIRVFFNFIKSRGINDLKYVGLDDLKEYRNYLSLKTGYSLSYICANIQALKLFWKFLFKTKMVRSDYTAVLIEPKIPRALPQAPLTPTEIKKMLEAPDIHSKLGIRDKAILETFYRTGIRVKEMSLLILSDLDLDNGFLFVRHGKGGKDRVVPLGQYACLVIKNYLTAARPLLAGESKTIMNKEGKPRATLLTTRLWLNRYGKPLHKGDIVILVRKYRNKAGITKQVTAHSFRRTLAVELVRNECDFITVKNILGHSMSRTTLRYCALSVTELKNALSKCHPRHELEISDDSKLIIKSFN